MNEERYFNKLCEVVEDIDYQNYSTLLHHLYNTPFHYILEKDQNRAMDGVNLRKRFGYFSNKPCNVLEMMIALAIRCEESVMMNVHFGDRTSIWFWSMVKNLGLWSQTDECYNKRQTEEILDIFMNRKYSPNGAGGLFTVQDYRQDLREVEIWYQAMWYFANLE